MLNRRDAYGLLAVAVALLGSAIGACGTSDSGGASGSSGRTQTKTKNPAEIIDSHASVLPSVTEGGTTACADGYKSCSDGGCCPADGNCAAGFICEVAPTACATCAGGITSGRCCSGNCCPDGSTCTSSGLCQTKRTEATVPCDTNNTQVCGDACCPAGSVCNNGVCDIHGATPPQCPSGEALCDNGECCPAGYTCSATTFGSSQCERAPDKASVSTTNGTCGTGETIVLPKGGNCPAITPTNSYYMHAMCCPVSSKLYCQYPSSSSPEPTCYVPTTPYVAGCPSGYTSSYDSYTGTTVCCPYSSSYPTVGDIDGDGVSECYYTSAYEPSCGTQSVDPATGKCCDGTATGTGGCCPSGSSTCGTGCCPNTDSCSTDGTCTTYPSDTPECPADAARRCTANDGSTVCCPLNTTCGPNGTCSCPLSAPVDCGSFCATDSSACGCPSDHPELCGGTCCLKDGCYRSGGSSGDTCSCPSTSISCGSGECCPQGTTCGDSYGVQGCFKCPDDAPTICGGKYCCSASERCQDGVCVGCPDTAPQICGKTCCTDTEICSNGTCKAGGTTHVGSGGSSGAGGALGRGGSTSGTNCTSVTACAGCTYQICISGAGTSSCSAYIMTPQGRYDCSDCTSSGCASIAQTALTSCCGTAATP